MSGSVAVVTGAAKGIGRAVAIRLAESGADLVLIDNSPCDLTASQIQVAGREPLCIEASVADEDAIRAAAEKVRNSDRFRNVTILVNNAATFKFGTVEQATSADWDEVLNVNIKGTAYVTKHFLPLLRESSKTGAIVNIGSISSFIGQQGFVPYSASKAAIVQMTKNMAMDHAGDGIRVNAVCPGPVFTGATVNLAATEGTTIEETKDALAASTMLKRMGTAKEVANAVCFLASEDASYITGTSLMVDGGYTAQ